MPRLTPSLFIAGDLDFTSVHRMKHALPADSPTLFVEEVPVPPPDSNFRSRREVLSLRIFTRLFTVALVFAIPYFLWTPASSVNFGADPKVVGASVTAILAVAIFFLIANDRWFFRPLLLATSPILVSNQGIRMPTTFFDRIVLRKEPIVRIERIESMTIKGPRKDLGRDRMLVEFVIITKDRRRYPSGPKLADEVSRLLELIRSRWPDIDVEIIGVSS